jgi:phosphotransferase system enzyme I (PtsI)
MLAAVLVGLGVTSVSVAAGVVAEVRQAIAERTLQRCRDAAARALAAPDPAAARAAAGAC